MEQSLAQILEGCCHDGQTAYEQRISHFVVQRSADGIKFADIGSAKARNINGESTYQLTDTKPLTGDNYYRLQIVEQDGKIEYSDIKWINVETTVSKFKVYPNPTNGNITAAFNSNQSGVCTLEVYDVFGKLVLSQAAECQLGNNSYQMGLGQLATGIYLLKIVSNDAVLSVAKFTKM